MDGQSPVLNEIKEFTPQLAYTSLQSHLLTHFSEQPQPPLPSLSTLKEINSSLPTTLPTSGLGPRQTHSVLLSLTPALTPSSLSANYYGFVTGGCLPIAEAADNIVSAFDQNVSVHLPDQGIGTSVEQATLGMLIDLLRLGEDGSEWKGVFTTGATGSNVLGLACGREEGVGRRLMGKGESRGVGELGVLEACEMAGVRGVRVLTSMGHSSLSKAASVVGIGGGNLIDVARGDEPWMLDLELLIRELRACEDADKVCIVVVSAGEVNTGRFGTDGYEMMSRVRKLCDHFRAWLHIDGAFGVFARCLPGKPAYQTLSDASSGLELADSITGDCHKMLNVPYDCGFFLTRAHFLPTLTSVFQNPNAAYLATTPSSTPSPLNVGLENSRRFRALPVYAVLLPLGKDGLADMFERQVLLARGIARYVNECEGLVLLG